jgi:predicted kinase
LDSKDVLTAISTPGLLILPIGLPGAGKSTLARLLVEREVIETHGIVSTDALRTAVGGRRDWLADDELVFRHVYEIVAARLRNGLTTYLDATNVRVDARNTAFAIAQSEGRPTLAVRFEASADTSRARRARDGVMYDDVVWDELALDLATIDWSRLPVPWLYCGDVARSLESST